MKTEAEHKQREKVAAPLVTVVGALGIAQTWAEAEAEHKQREKVDMRLVTMVAALGIAEIFIGFAGAAGNFWPALVISVFGLCGLYIGMIYTERDRLMRSDPALEEQSQHGQLPSSWHIAKFIAVLLPRWGEEFLEELDDRYEEFLKSRGRFRANLVLSFELLRSLPAPVLDAVRRSLVGLFTSSRTG